MTKMNLFMYTTQQAGDKDHRNPPQLSAGSVSLCRYAEGIILFRVDGEENRCASLDTYLFIVFFLFSCSARLVCVWLVVLKQVFCFRLTNMCDSVCFLSSM